jgi:hypothetical protein
LQAATEGHFDPVQERQIHAHLPIPSDLSSRSFHGCAIRLSTDKFTIEATFTNGLQVRLFYRARIPASTLSKKRTFRLSNLDDTSILALHGGMSRGVAAADRLLATRQFKLLLR